MSNQYSRQLRRSTRKSAEKNENKENAGYAREHAHEENLDSMKKGHFSRSEVSIERVNRDSSVKMLPIHAFIIVITGAILSLTFYVSPLFGQLATPVQSQNLYSGFAMTKGLTPFNDFFVSGGTLFYLINWLGNIGQSSLLLYLFEIIALVTSGIISYRLIAMQTKRASLSLNVALFVMLAATGLSYGGSTPTLFALPFSLWAAKFLEVYFHKDARDEKFILFGFAGAAVFVISPIMVFFFLLSILSLFIYNIVHHRIGRGFYQVFASLFGALVIGYTVAYYALNEQVLFTSVQQAVILPFTHLGLSNHFLFSLVKLIILFIVFGFAAGFIQGIKQIRNAGKLTIWYVFLLIGIVLVTLINLLEPNFDSTNFLSLVPFLIVFIGHRFKDLEEGQKGIFGKFIRGTFFAPIFSLVFAFALPVTYAVINHTVYSDEKEVAQFIKANSTEKDKVFVLGADKNINLLSKRVASFDIPPAYYPLDFQQTFDLKANQIKDKFVVVQSGQKIPESLNQALKDNYEAMNFENGNFKVYQNKNT